MFRQLYVRYIVASGGALGLDIVVFLTMLSVGLAPTLAAGTGYMSGLLFHWFASSRVVFSGRLAAEGAQRRQQQALFLGSAVLGLAVTLAVVGTGDLMGADARLTKIIAVALSFQATYELRKRLVFA